MQHCCVSTVLFGRNYQMKRLMLRNHIALAAAGMIAAAAFPAVPAAAADAPSVLILGDSISAGDGLKEGEFGYYDYVADCTGGTLTNLAKSGSTTSDVIAVIDDAANKDTIADADIICISAGGNDLMQPAKAYFETMAKEGENLIDTAKRVAKEGNAVKIMAALTGKLRPYRTEAQANLIVIAEKLHELNPDAQIILQTTYNPFEMPAEQLKASGYSDETIKNYNYLMGYVNNNELQLDNVMRALAGVTLKDENGKDVPKEKLGGTIEVNKVVVEKAEGVKVADVSYVFDGAGWLYNRILEKDIHPSVLGHVMIASVVIDQLEDVNIRSARMTQAVENLKQSLYQQIPTEHKKKFNERNKSEEQIKEDGGIVEEKNNDDPDLTRIKKYAVDVYHMKGDFDNSGEIGIEDVQNMLRVYTEGVSGKKIEDNVTALQFITGDVNEDNTISIDDVLYTLIYYVEHVVAHSNTDWPDILPAK